MPRRGRPPRAEDRAVTLLEDAAENAKHGRYASAALHAMAALSHLVDLRPSIKAEVTKLAEEVWGEGS